MVPSKVTGSSTNPELRYPAGSLAPERHLERSGLDSANQRGPSPTAQGTRLACPVRSGSYFAGSGCSPQSPRRKHWRWARRGRCLTWARKVDAPLFAADSESLSSSVGGAGEVGRPEMQREEGEERKRERPEGSRGREDAAAAVAAAESPRSRAPPRARPSRAPRLPRPACSRPAQGPPGSATVRAALGLALPPPQCRGGGALGPASWRSQPSAPQGTAGLGAPESPAQPRPRAARASGGENRQYHLFQTHKKKSGSSGKLLTLR